MTPWQPSCTLAGALLLLLQAHCGPEEEQGSLAELAHHGAEVLSSDVQRDEPTPVRRLDFRFFDPSAREPQRCAWLVGATILINGRPPAEVVPGGWEPRNEGWKGTYGGHCRQAVVSASLDDLTGEPRDAILEIEGEGLRFVLVVPGLYVRRELPVVSTEPGAMVLQMRPPLELSGIQTWMRKLTGNPEVPNDGRLDSLLRGDTLVVFIPAAARSGSYELNAVLTASMPVASCEGLPICRASAELIRRHGFKIP